MNQPFSICGVCGAHFRHKGLGGGPFTLGRLCVATVSRSSLGWRRLDDRLVSVDFCRDCTASEDVQRGQASLQRELYPQRTSTQQGTLPPRYGR
jgi:hypothetical protein